MKAKYQQNTSKRVKSPRIIPILQNELIITWALCRNNLPAMLAEFIGSLLPRLFIRPMSLQTNFQASVNILIICFLFAYIFDIGNTTSSVEEDRINKPHRPIPSGLITLKQGYLRWILSWLLAPCIASILYGELPAFLIIFEEVWVFAFYVWPTFHHWLSKTIMSTTLAYVILRLVNATLQCSDVESWSVNKGPDLIIAAWTFCSIHLQDFRDVEGDYRTHTVTIVTMLSPVNRRRLLQGTAIFIILINIFSIFLICTRASHVSAFISGFLFYVSSGIMVHYMWSASSKIEYRIMYRWWTAALFFIIYHVYDLYLSEA